MRQAQINVRTRACSRTSIARTKQAALTHNVRGKELMKTAQLMNVYVSHPSYHFVFAFNASFINVDVSAGTVTRRTIDRRDNMETHTAATLTMIILGQYQDIIIFLNLLSGMLQILKYCNFFPYLIPFQQFILTYIFC